MITLCLAHDIHAGTPNGCPKANHCMRHTLLRNRLIQAEAPITGAVCSTNDYLLYWDAASDHIPGATKMIEDDDDCHHCGQDADDCDEDQSGICSTCNGSGEGQYEGATCYRCHGRGVR
jgi:hypothetical protein